MEPVPAVPAPLGSESVDGALADGSAVSVCAVVQAATSARVDAATSIFTIMSCSCARPLGSATRCQRDKPQTVPGCSGAGGGPDGLCGGSTACSERERRPRVARDALAFYGVFG